MRTAIYCVSKNGYETCLKIKENVYNDLHIYVSGRVANLLNLENENIENLFIINERVPILLEKTFNKYDLHIFVAATGAVVRIIDGKFKSKDTDPAVITVDDHANFVISLLSGHLGGANEECEKIAQGIDAIPVITTASDVGGKIAVDTFSQKIKAKLEDLEGAKRVTSLIVNGEKVSLHLPKNIVSHDENSAGAIIVSNRKNIEISKIIPQNIFIGKLEDLIEEKSEYVKKTIGVYGVSEPCAFLASSGKGTFLAKKIKLDGMTLSIFEEEIENQEGK